jgi:hypothetical protein
MRWQEVLGFTETIRRAIRDSANFTRIEGGSEVGSKEQGRLTEAEREREREREREFWASTVELPRGRATKRQSPGQRRADNEVAIVTR